MDESSEQSEARTSSGKSQEHLKSNSLRWDAANWFDLRTTVPGTRQFLGLVLGYYKTKEKPGRNNDLNE